MQCLKNLVLTFTVFLNFTVFVFSQQKIDNNVIIIPKGQSRSFMLTNDCTSFFFSETGRTNTSSLQGLNVQTHEFLEDYIIEVNGKALKRKTAEAYLYPNKLIRKYDKLMLDEEISLMDSLPVLIIKLTSTKKLPLALVPVISGNNKMKKFVPFWSEEDKLLYIAQKGHMVRSKRENYPVWIGVYAYPEAEFIDMDSDFQRSYVGYIKKEGFLPGKLNLFLDGTAYIFFIIGDNKNDVLQNRRQVLKKFNIYLEKTKQKISGVRKT